MYISAAEKIFISGGKGSNVGSLDKIFVGEESLGTWNHPETPPKEHGYPLVLVDSRIYICGGYPFNDKCYVLDTKEINPTWYEIPGIQAFVPMSLHAGLAMGTNIWFVYIDTLYEYDTITGIIVMHSLPFIFSFSNCAVANTEHSYFLGAGDYRDEIWMNAYPSDPTQWIKVGMLESRRGGLSCVLIGDEIYIQGGQSPGHISSKETYAFNIKSASLRRLSDMVVARAFAKAMILDCGPAVVGGLSGKTPISSIEVYNLATDEWTVSGLELQYPRYHFGLIQF